MNNLAAEDLMVGDWVQIKNHLDYDRVQEIARDEKGKWYISFACSATLFKAYEWEPVKLTSDILEKNGFIKDDGGEDCWGNDAGWMISNDYHNGTIVSWKVEILGDPNSFNGIISYVHELQHALRICGIDLEITL